MRTSNSRPLIILSYIAFELAILISSPTVCQAGPHQRRLIYHLLDPYNIMERPVAKESEPIRLSLGLSLQQILDVDTRTQQLTTNMWMFMSWKDAYLSWNSSEYGNIKSIRLALRRIWEPDVYLFNSVDEHFDVSYDTKVVVQETGICHYAAPVIFKSSCKIDVTWFPFDYQTCELKFGSWTYDGLELDLTLRSEEGGDLSGLVSNNEWELLEMPAKRSKIYYNCCPEPYVALTYEIVMRRRPFFYLFNIIVPCLLMSSMALLGFAVPSDSGEKLTIGITSLLSITFYFIVMSNSMPITSDKIPILEIYLSWIWLMVASSVVSTALILNIHHRNTAMPQWFRVLFLQLLPWVLLMNLSNEDSCDSGEGKPDRVESFQIEEIQCTRANGIQHESNSYTNSNSIQQELSLILKELRQITKQLCTTVVKRDIKRDWKYAAKVLDRLCFVIFVVFMVVITLVVLSIAPDYRLYQSPKNVGYY